MKQPANVVRSLVTNNAQSSGLDLSKVVEVDHFSSLKKLLRVTAYVMRFINALKIKQGGQSANSIPIELSASEVKLAELMWVKSIQGQSFSNEISFVATGNARTVAPAYVQQFGLFFDDDHVLRCKGRLNNASLNLGSKNPILLPSKSRFLELLICEIHQRIKHSGIRDTLTTIRERFWLIRGRQAVKKVIRKCVVCRKAEGLPYGVTPPPDLPASRVSEEPPFTNVRRTRNIARKTRLRCMSYCSHVRLREQYTSSLPLHYKYQPFLEHSEDMQVEEVYPPHLYQTMRKHFVHHV